MPTSTQYFAYGEPQLQNLALDAKANAQRSLSSLAPGVTPENRAAIQATLNPLLPYFRLDDAGLPILVIPPAPEPEQPFVFNNGAPLAPLPTETIAPTVAPAASVAASTQPAGTPTSIITSGACPSGFVHSQALTGSADGQTLDAAISSAFTSLPKITTQESAGCLFTPTLAAQQVVTKDDLLQVHVVNVAASEQDVVIMARVLLCDGTIQNMQMNVSVAKADWPTAFDQIQCMHLTDGFLLGVTATSNGVPCLPGSVWVQAAIVNPNCSGELVVPLFADYLSLGNFLGWPGGRQLIPGDGAGADIAIDFRHVAWSDQFIEPFTNTLSLVKSVSLRLTTSAVVANRNFYVELEPNAQQLIRFAASNTQPASTTYDWTFAPGVGPSFVAGLNLIQVPIPPNLYMTDLDQIALRGVNTDAGDHILLGGVLLKTWAGVFV